MNNKYTYTIDWNKALNYKIVFSRNGGSLHDLSVSFHIERELDELETLVEKSNMVEAKQLLERILK